MQNKEKCGKSQAKREKQIYNTEEFLYFFKALLFVGSQGTLGGMSSVEFS